MINKGIYSEPAPQGVWLIKWTVELADSPIIGTGSFADNEIGSTVATGLGEEVVKTAGIFLVVEPNILR